MHFLVPFPENNVTGGKMCNADGIYPVNRFVVFNE